MRGCNIMAWDKSGRYYSRSRRVSGRVTREYIGAGPVGWLAAYQDAEKLRERAEARAARMAERAHLDALADSVRDLDDVADLLVQVAMLATGHRQHNRGEWRKRRGKP
jgi:hypothetical protein